MQLIFIHGSGSTEKVWKYQTRHFSGAIAITLSGHPDGELIDSVGGMSDRLKQYVDEHALSELVLVGHSMGGGIALQYALDYPEDLQALILVGSGGRLRVHPDTLSDMEQSLDQPESIKSVIDSFWHNVDPEFAAELKADGLALGPRVLFNDFKACDKFDVMDRLHEIRCPTLAIVGSEDVMTPQKYAQFMVEEIPKADLEVIQGGTHCVFAEKPAEVNDAIESFLTRAQFESSGD